MKLNGQREEPRAQTLRSPTGCELAGVRYRNCCVGASHCDTARYAFRFTHSFMDYPRAGSRGLS